MAGDSNESELLRVRMNVPARYTKLSVSLKLDDLGLLKLIGIKFRTIFFVSAHSFGSKNRLNK